MVYIPESPIQPFPHKKEGKRNTSMSAPATKKQKTSRKSPPSFSTAPSEGEGEQGAALPIQKQASRIVFRHTLGQPFTFVWPSWKPSVNLEDHNAKIIELIQSISPLVRKTIGRGESKPRGVDLNMTTERSFIIGIQSLTNTLQSLINSGPFPASKKGSDDDSSKDLQMAKPRLPEVVFICRGDISSPIMYSHLPTLLWLASIATKSDPPYLVCLPPGSEAILAKDFGIRSVAAMGVIRQTPSGDSSSALDPLVHYVAEKMPRIHVPWIPRNYFSCPKYQPTFIRTLQTTAPLRAQRKQKVVRKTV